MPTAHRQCHDDAGVLIGETWCLSVRPEVAQRVFGMIVVGKFQDGLTWIPFNDDVNDIFED